MDFTNFALGKDDSGRRLDRILRKFLSEESLSTVYKSLRKGLIKIDGKKADGNFRVSEGSNVQIADFLLKKDSESEKSKSMGYQKSQKKIPSLKTDSIIFRNDAILILNKPYDIPVQPAGDTKFSLSEIVQEEYEKTHGRTSLSFRTGPLHRLDRKTTGLIAFSQNLEGAKWFSESIKTHGIKKIYLAILEGNIRENQFWEDEIKKNDGKSKKFKTVSVNSGNGKTAVTKIEPLARGIFEKKEITLAKIFIETGRTHQIRSQSAYHGHPLLGDEAYGGSKIDFREFGQDFFLHAYELRLPENPVALPEILVAPLPASFIQFWENYGENTDTLPYFSI